MPNSKGIDLETLTLNIHPWAPIYERGSGKRTLNWPFRVSDEAKPASSDFLPAKMGHGRQQHSKARPLSSIQRTTILGQKRSSGIVASVTALKVS